MNSSETSTTIYPEVTSSPNVPAIEEAILAIWEKNGTFQASVEGKKNNPTDEKEAGNTFFMTVHPLQTDFHTMDTL